MLLLETSAWVAYLRDRGGAAEIRQLMRDHIDELLGCPAVRMELAVDSDELRRRRVLRWYDGFPSTDVVADDFEVAAAITRAVRASGHTVRSPTDCLIAAAAIRTGSTVVHRDVDFDRMAAVVPELQALRIPS